MSRSKVGLHVYEIEVVTPILAPAQPRDTVKAIVERYGLREKYRERREESGKEKDLAEHLDRVFLRVVHPLKGQQCVWIPGSSLKSAIKEAAGIPGKATEGFEVWGAYFDENDARLFTFRVTAEKEEEGKKKLRPTLMNAEAILPGSKGEVIITGKSIEEIAPHIDMKKGLMIVLGAYRSRGYGRAIIRRVA